jgi:hypothetical protein
MLERFIQQLGVDDPGAAKAAEIRERLKGRFPPGATRRMTTLGLLVGSVLEPLSPQEGDTLVYATAFAESGALESFLDSFPGPSPTLFQTSIHPSAVQQLMIGRQHPVREFLPLSGGGLLAFHALRAALVSAAPRTVLCGGEERGTWLLDFGLASPRTFAFALALTTAEPQSPLGRVRLEAAPGDGELGLPALFDLLAARRPFHGPVAPGWRLELAWQ